MWKKFLLGLVVIFVLIGALALYFVWKVGKSGEFRSVLITEVAKKTLPKDLNSDAIIGTLLGISRSQTYLVLLLNNTELRPGGGFIGAYAVVRFTNGYPQVLQIDGTEVLDLAANPALLPLPPAPLKKYLKVDRWYFRDSNWSPDFASSSRRGLDIYRREGGTLAEEIRGVIGFTPTVIEEVLQLTGPITVQGKEYTAKNFTENLEREVEYGFSERGVLPQDRKDVLAAIFLALEQKVQPSIVRQWPRYSTLLERMLAQKQIVLYSEDADIQSVLERHNWAGTASVTPGVDSLQWVDANLGALKTDAAMKRSLSYRATSTPNGFMAEAEMLYEHTGVFDWRTSRYQTYARVFVPRGTKLLQAMSAGRVVPPQNIDQGEEDGRAWFGTFITIEPGEKKRLAFRYTFVSESPKSPYAFMVKKQVGSVPMPLTVSLNFDRTVVAAAPAELEREFGNASYNGQLHFLTDQLFTITLAP